MLTFTNLCAIVNYLIFTVIIVISTVKFHSLAEEINWDRELYLDDDFLLRWNNQDPEYLIMEMSATVKGYIAVGFSPNGGMRGSDIIMGWVDSSGQAHIKDLYADGNTTPMEDDSNDVELLLAEEYYNNEDVTIIRFRRRWNTCDTSHDFEITDDTVRLIWAMSESDPVRDPKDDHLIFHYHGTSLRGSKSMFLKVDPNTVHFPDEEDWDFDTFFWDVTMDMAKIKGDEDTSYYCKVFKIPDFAQNLTNKYQIIGYRPLIDEENEQWVHHMNLFECHVPTDIGKDGDVFEKYVDHPGEECYKKNMPPEWAQYCITFPITWAIGADGLMLPENGGFPLWEEHNGTTYFLLEIHYDNPELLKFEDNSGLRVYITSKPREYDYGQISIHSRFGQFQLIPPKSANFKTTAFCTDECTNSSIPPEGITVTHCLLHGHLTARKMTVRHIRNGVELPPIAQDLHYDFNYQQMRSVNPTRKVYPGDILMTECEYDTSDRDNITFGGTSTRDEMCQGVVSYYPKIPLALCKSQIEFNNFFHALGIDHVDGEKVLEKLQLPYHPTANQLFDPGDDAYVLKNGLSGEPEYPFDLLQVADPVWKRAPPMTVRQYLNSLNWKDKEFVNTVWKQWWGGKQVAMCTGHGHLRIPLKDYLVDYPKFIPYEKPKSTLCKNKANLNLQRGTSGVLSNLKSDTENILILSMLSCLYCMRLLLKM